MTNTHHPVPNYGTASPQMKFDMHGSPSPYEIPQGVFSHGHPIPMGYHGCCNYSYVPAYYPPPPPFYYHGPYPLILPMYPVHYTPPPHYPIEQPRYECDKNQLTDHHCCGCPNNHCNKKEDRQVKIEQREPGIENISTNSLVPVGPKSQPYPIVWAPQGYMNTKEQRNSNEPEHRQGGENPSDLRNVNNVEATGKGNENLLYGEKNQVPFPISWMPYKASEEGEKNHDELVLSGTKGNNGMIELLESEGSATSDAAPEEMKKKTSNVKLIPVKQMGESGEKRDKEIAIGKGNREKQLLGNVTRSKLPPICLRVDPLQKKRNGSNGNSRSPSPKRNGEKSSNSAHNEKKEAKSSEREKKVIEVVSGKSKENSGEVEKIEGSKDINESEEKRVEETKELEVTNTLEKTNKEEINMKKKKGETNMSEETEKVNCERGTKAWRILSDAEAAIIIQSAYRGFKVRRWDPLKKLKQISEIREKMGEVRSRIEALEASSDGGSDNKERVVIGETIMSLLLKLDAIQGLYTTVKEIRKSVAKELVSLQEQLDSMGNESSESFTGNVGNDPMGGQDKTEVGHGSSVVAPETVVPKVTEKEVCEEAKDGAKPVSSICELNDVGAKVEIMPSDCVVSKDENISSGELAIGTQDDLGNHEMLTMTNDSEPKLHTGFVLEAKLHSCAVDALTDQLSVCDGEVSVKEDKHNDLMSVETCEQLQAGDFKSPSIDAIDAGIVLEAMVPCCAVDALADQPTVCDGEISVKEDKHDEQIPIEMLKQGGDSKSLSSEVFAIKEELQGPLDECKDNSLPKNLEDEFNREVGIEIDDHCKVEQKKILERMQEEEDQDRQSGVFKTPQVDMEDTSEAIASMEELRGTLDECKNNSLSEDLEDEIKKELSIVSDDNNRVERKRVLEEEEEEECRFLDSTKDNYAENLDLSLPVGREQEGKEAELVSGMSYVSTTEPEQPFLELPPEICAMDGPKAEGIHCEEAAPKSKDMKGCEAELVAELGEENEDSLENKYVIEVANGENNKNMEQEETLNNEKRVDIGKKGLGSDKKLVEENEKLREMVAKLVETSKEQLSVISSLSGRMKELEMKLARKKKPKIQGVGVGSSCVKPSDPSVKVSVREVAV